MRKILVAILLIAVVALPAFTLGIELGVSGTPAPSGEQGKTEFIWGAHVGISPVSILYASWDSLILPPGAISGMTGYVDETTGVYYQGPYVPGFLNLFDVGMRLILGPVVALLEIGTNQIHVYAPDEAIGVKSAGGFGANLRVGLGLKFGVWGVTVTGTYVASSMDKLIGTMKGLVADSTRQWALNEIVKGLVPSIMAVVYF